MMKKIIIAICVLVAIATACIAIAELSSRGHDEFIQKTDEFIERMEEDR